MASAAKLFFGALFRRCRRLASNLGLGLGFITTDDTGYATSRLSDDSRFTWPQSTGRKRVASVASIASIHTDSFCQVRRRRWTRLPYRSLASHQPQRRRPKAGAAAGGFVLLVLNTQRPLRYVMALEIVHICEEAPRSMLKHTIHVYAQHVSELYRALRRD